MRTPFEQQARDALCRDSAHDSGSRFRSGLTFLFLGLGGGGLRTQARGAGAALVADVRVVKTAWARPRCRSCGFRDGDRIRSSTVVGRMVERRAPC